MHGYMLLRETPAVTKHYGSHLTDDGSKLLTKPPVIPIGMLKSMYNNLIMQIYYCV